MSSTPATQETKTEEQLVEIRCNDPLLEGGRQCTKLVLKNGEIICTSNRCKQPHSLATLYVANLLRGGTDYEEFMRAIRQQLTHFDYRHNNSPAHERVREIMGDNFISLPEMFSNFGQISLAETQTYLELLSIPFSEETLQEFSTTHWLLPIIPWSVSATDEYGHAPRRGYRLEEMLEYGSPTHKAICSCHRDWRHSLTKNSILNTGMPGRRYRGRWLLVEKNPQIYCSHKKLRSPQAYSHYGHGINLRVLDAPTIVYADAAVREVRNTRLLQELRVWAKPVVARKGSTEIAELPALSLCREPHLPESSQLKEHQQRIAIDIYPATHDGEGIFITEIIPDKD